MSVDMKNQKYQRIADRTNFQWNKFGNLYHPTIHKEHHVPKKIMQKINEELTQKYIPKPIIYLPISADQPDMWQADLMFDLPIMLRT